MAMLRGLLAVLALSLPLALEAQDESLAVDGDEESSTWEVGAAACGGAACNAAACDDEADESPQAADGNIVATVTDGAAMFFDCPTPTNDPDGTQTYVPIEG